MNKDNNSFSQQDVQILEHEILYQGYLQIDKYILRHKLFNGGWSKSIRREAMVHGPAVGVLPYDPHLNKVVLIEQFRIGVLEKEKNPWLIECIAGGWNPQQETAEEVAAREIQEEAGLIIQNLIPICNYWVSAGSSTERTMIFCAKVNAEHAGGIYGLTEEDEDIRATVWDIDQAFAAVAEGRINNASSIIALQWLQINLEKVRSEWGQ